MQGETADGRLSERQVCALLNEHAANLAMQDGPLRLRYYGMGRTAAGLYTNALAFDPMPYGTLGDVWR